MNSNMHWCLAASIVVLVPGIVLYHHFDNFWSQIPLLISTGLAAYVLGRSE